MDEGDLLAQLGVQAHSAEQVEQSVIGKVRVQRARAPCS